MGMSPKHPQRYRHLELEKKILDLRLQGFSFRQIGEMLNRSWQYIQLVYHKAFDRTLRERQESATECIQMELAKLDKYQQKVHNLVIETIEGEDPQARIHQVLEGVDRLLRIAERRAKLLGLDKPEKKVEVQVGLDFNQLSDEELRGEMEKLGMTSPDPVPITYQLPGEVLPQTEVSPETETEKDLPSQE